MEDKAERIIYHLINFEQQKDELKERPYMIFEDMAVVFDHLRKDGMSIDRIDHNCAMANGWTKEFLWENAKKNTRDLLSVKIEPFHRTLIGHTEDEPSFFLSNKIQRYGAGVILYDDLLHDFSMKYGYNLYLLPTSIHEFVILLDRGIYLEEKLFKILKDSNQNLSKHEFLSENIYYYDRMRKELISLF